MDKVFEEVRPLIVEQENVDWLVETEKEWNRLPQGEKLLRIHKMVKLAPSSETAQQVYKELQAKWDEDQKFIANRHITMYMCEPDVFAGYTFIGRRGPEQKWQVNGTREFVDAFMSVENEATAEVFKQTYAKFEGVIEDIQLNELRRLDTTYPKNRVQRVMLLAKAEGEDVKDSGWEPCQ